ncbi:MULTISPECIES: CD3324 family protein [Clostridium]|jgi:Mor family transcriptional regulator|uniref:Mor transcription activator family n=1 Tax=Clostridium saccharoperbutylacetonicum N1-4(HMT) TaxID=931276 RepID=M1MD64_9CLOT|nr:MULTISPECIES: CD3324 family protein [Clostridium]AGF54328.1 Mor transcription activator family [Clostridium saccharoperbutylacetonicum N1-4(HMT)]AQR93246.1 Mor transcription activator family protein [Clostridium saccharoperbutylacetonicum]NRT59156.1 Mor family transcriptional regulator [Clostridium saccharoperbutylacetonicum]NSB28345.1 Mor family transcriptional regulator [Clostridium saccharoperbutylacetonicum]NSB34663.1 Mor family transcriptional regulator [Clostridium saccharoperbutylace
MKYEKAQNILPQQIIEIIQNYTDGGYIYIPRKDDNKKSWGENTETKNYLKIRDNEIFNKYSSGLSVKILSQQYFLTEHSIRRIIRKQKNYD